MRPTSKDLALRDPARAALLGALGGPDADFGHNFGDEWGSEFGDDPPPPAVAAWLGRQSTEKRALLLSPNKNSKAKIQRYVFAVNEDIVLSTSSDIETTGKPETVFRPQRITANVPVNGFATLTSMKVANVGILVGGTVDAYDFNANGQDQALDVPTLSPQNEVKIDGDYTGLLPPGYTEGEAFLLCISLKGPATMYPQDQ